MIASSEQENYDEYLDQPHVLTIRQISRMIADGVRAGLAAYRPCEHCKLADVHAALQPAPSTATPKMTWHVPEAHTTPILSKGSTEADDRRIRLVSDWMRMEDVSDVEAAERWGIPLDTLRAGLARLRAHLAAEAAQKSRRHPRVSRG